MKHKTIVYAGAFSGLSLVLSLLIHFPLVPQAPFLLYDPGDVPILSVTFKYGPALGIFVTTVVSILFGVITGQGGPWGILMHILATGSYILIAGMVYRARRSYRGAILSLILATLLMTAIMVAANLVVTPLYLGVPRSTVVSMLLPAIIPFNLLKGAINGMITLLLYKKIIGFLEGTRHLGTVFLKQESEKNSDV
ncbi:MAG TPA: ECF transporter S component [Atribacteraceae bacterium]|nr:ECF transporter S component [Atribacteraceae bacterium]